MKTAFLLALGILLLGCANDAFTIGQASYWRCDGTATIDSATGVVVCNGIWIKQDGGPISIPFANLVGNSVGMARQIGLSALGVPTPPPSSTSNSEVKHVIHEVQHE